MQSKNAIDECFRVEAERCRAEVEARKDADALGEVLMYAAILAVLAAQVVTALLYAGSTIL